MKYMSAVILGVLVFTGVSLAQVGITIGVNVFIFKGASVFKFNPRTAASGGLYWDMPGDGFSFMPEILYSQKGATFSTSILESGVKIPVDATMRYDYIEIPLLAKYTLTTNSSFRPFLIAGPYLGILISSALFESGTVTAGEDPITVLSDITGQQRIDYGLTFGGGARFDIGTNSFNVNIRYSVGEVAADKGELKNTGISIMAGFLF